MWTIGADGSDPVAVTDTDSVDWSPVWAPDGAHLYFASDRGGVTNPWRVSIDEVTGSISGEPQPITLPTSWSGQLAVSADGSRLAYRTSEMKAEFRRLPFDAGGGTLTGPVERVFDTAIPAVGLDVSADGWITFRTAAMQEDVYVMRVDGGGLRKLTDDAAKDRYPVWSPDGTQVAFYSNRSGRYEIWTVGRDGSDLRQRTETPGERSNWFPVWSPDGRFIVTSSEDRVARFPVREQPVSAAEMEVLPIDRGDAAFAVPLSWSPDGRRLAGVRIGHNGQLLPGLLIYDLSANASRFLPVDFPVPPAGHVWPVLSWLADSRRGVVRWLDRILVLDAESERITTLADGFHPDGGFVRASSDGRWLYMLDSRNEGDLWLASRR